jgi:Derlin-2/3
MMRRTRCITSNKSTHSYQLLRRNVPVSVLLLLVLAVINNGMNYSKSIFIDAKPFILQQQYIQQQLRYRNDHSAILLPVQPNRLHNPILSPPQKHVGNLYVQQLLQSSLARGGAVSRDGDDDNEENDVDDVDDDDDDDDLLLDFDNDDMDIGSSDINGFGETTLLDRLMVAYTKTPPFTKMYLSISFVITLYSYLCNKNEFPNILLLQWNKVITQLQIWRIITSFFHFGPFGIGYIMTLQFVWVYMSTLERIHHHRPYDFWIMILFGQLCMVIGYPIMKLSPKFLGHNLSTFLVYIWSRYHEGVEVNMFELFNTRAEMLPWFFLGQTFLLEGEVPILDFLGIVFGHIYHHCKTVGILRAPQQLTKWYENSDAAQYIRELYKPISSDFDVP